MKAVKEKPSDKIVVKDLPENCIRFPVKNFINMSEDFALFTHLANLINTFGKQKTIDAMAELLWENQNQSSK
jgi:hypothetical protein